MSLVLVAAVKSIKSVAYRRESTLQLDREIEITIPVSGGIQVSRSNHEDNEALKMFLMTMFDEDRHDEIKKFFDAENDVELIHGSESFCG